MVNFFIGVVAGTVGVLAGSKISRHFLIKRYDRFLKENEQVLCTDATVVCDTNGELAWFDNTHELMIVKISRKKD